MSKIPVFRNGILTYQHTPLKQIQITLGDASWNKLISTGATSFRYEDNWGSFTARPRIDKRYHYQSRHTHQVIVSRKQIEGDEWQLIKTNSAVYWYAYRTVQNNVTRVYLGAASQAGQQVTLERMQWISIFLSMKGLIILKAQIELHCGIGSERDRTIHLYASVKDWNATLLICEMTPQASPLPRMLSNVVVPSCAQCLSTAGRIPLVLPAQNLEREKQQ